MNWLRIIKNLCNKLLPFSSQLSNGLTSETFTVIPNRDVVIPTKPIYACIGVKGIRMNGVGVKVKGVHQTLLQLYQI
jgi:hypothetical protein